MPVIRIMLHVETSTQAGCAKLADQPGRRNASFGTSTQCKEEFIETPCIEFLASLSLSPFRLQRGMVAK